MICVPYNRAETLKKFALAAELLRESEITEADLLELTAHELHAIERFLRFPNGSLLSDLIFGEDPRCYTHAVNRKISEFTPSNMHGRLRLPEGELFAILRRHKATGATTWNQNYLRECEQLAAARDSSRIARWNARNPNHHVK